jgi:uncharacterized protein YeaO (DUF488 family)
MAIKLKRVYEDPSRSDGFRVLVDRLWPRGLSKDAAATDAWLREIAPSNELRKWYHTNPGHWTTFRKRYLKELTTPAAAKALEQLYTLVAKKKNLTLLFGSRNLEHNNATVLRELLNGTRKPPTGSGPGAIQSAGLRRAAARRR